ncbi:MAG TPA: hypothetical protein PLI09_12285 [Candidatus Hydrogenedentes bacterium]|nr:hypothetical protein [Candidatus Hydrogenedentota bacterium]
MNAVKSLLLCVGLTMALACAGWSVEDAQTPLAVDFGKSAGKIKAFHGVNNGPVNWGIGPDLTNYHKEAGFPSSRLHDCHCAGLNEVDIHFIVPIFEADADDPMYYRFAETDAYIAGMVNIGVKITYRLGESIECRSTPRFRLK